MASELHGRAAQGEEDLRRRQRLPRLRTRLSHLTLGLVLAAACSSAEEPTTTASTTSSTIALPAAEVLDSRKLFARIDADDPSAGCTAAVSSDGEVVWAEAFGGDLTVDTRVDIASVSKQFTATAILLLGVDVGSTVADHLDGVPDWVGEVTVGELLHMESGIPDYVSYLPRDVVTSNADVLEVLDEMEAEEPDYSNTSYVLLAEIVEAVDGRDLPTYLTAEVFDPLELDAIVDPRGTLLQTGDGAIRTTPTELVEWAAQYWAPTIGPDDITERRLENAESYGAGIISVPDDELGPLLYHDGLWDHATTFDLLPEERLAAAVTCTDPDMPEADEDLAYALLEIWTS